jgi:flagellar motor switch protein FliN/FliY
MDQYQDQDKNNRNANALEGLSELEKNTICETANISMGAAATALSLLLGKKIEVAIPRIIISSRNKLKLDYPLPFFIVRLNYNEGFIGENILAIKKRDAAVIVDLMMGGTGINPSEEFDPIHLSALAEAMNQMMGSSAGALSFMLNCRVVIATPELSEINFATEELDSSIAFGNTYLVLINIKMFIENLIDSEIMQIIPLKFAKEMACSLINKLG